MSGPWQSDRKGDEETWTCARCDRTVRLDDEPPCEHGVVTCDGCDGTDACASCFTEAMDGPEWQDADPLFDPEAHARRRTDFSVAGFDPVTNSYTRRTG